MKVLLLIFVIALFHPVASRAEPLLKKTEEHFAEINGIRLHYVQMGSGPLLVLLHGWPETWYEWREVMPLLGLHFTVIAPDLRGLGLSEKTRTGYNKKTVATDIAFLIRKLGKEQAIVVGHDMGGKVAYFLALLHPELVRKLVLVDSMPPGTENMDPSKGGLWHYGFHMASGFSEMLTKGREREYISALMKVWLHKKNAISQDTIDEYTVHYASPGGMTAGFNYYRALPEDAKFLNNLGNRKFLMPVLIITGQFGLSEKPYKIMKDKADNITGVIVKGSGHFVPEESPGLLAEQIVKFSMSSK